MDVLNAVTSDSSPMLSGRGGKRAVNRRVDGPGYTPINVSSLETLIGKKIVSIAEGKDRTFEFDAIQPDVVTAYTLLLAADGTVYMYYFGQYVEPVPGLTGVKAIAVGYHHYLALGADGNVYGWGEGNYWQLGEGYYEGSPTPVQIQGLSNIKAVASGGYHSLALDEAGNVFSWGDGGFQLDNYYAPGGNNLHMMRKVWGPGATAIAAGDWHSLLIGADGMVYEWGYHRSSQGIHPDIPARKSFWQSPLPIKQVQGIVGARAVAAELFTSHALSVEGKVYQWGYVRKEFQGLYPVPGGEGETISYTYYEDKSSYTAEEVQVPFPPTCVDPVVAFTASTATLGFSTTFTDLSTNVTQDAVYAWDFNGDGVSDSNAKGNASFTYPAAGTHTARLTIGNGICEKSHVITVTVKAPIVSGVQWDYRFGGTGNDQLYTVLQTSDGGFLLGGTSTSSNTGDKTETTRGGKDYWIVKVDSTGIKQWDKRFGGFADDELRSLTQTSDGGFLLAGSSLSETGGDKSEVSRGGLDYWIVKVNNSGVKLWNKRFGGSADDQLRSVTPTSDGGFLLGGYSASDISGDRRQSNQGLTDYWIVKVTGTGTKQWDRRFGGAAADELHTMVNTPDGGFLLGGFSASRISGDKTEASRGGKDFWIVKVGSTGAKLWDKRFGGTDEDVLNSLAVTPDGGFLLGGTSLSGTGPDMSEVSRGGMDYWVIKVNSAGTKLWNRRFGGSADDELNGVILTSDGGFLLGGRSASGISGDRKQASQGLTDYWIVKISGPGAKQWDKRYGGSAEDELHAMLQTRDGGYLLGGFSASGVSGDKTQPSQGLTDYWILKEGNAGTSQASLTTLDDGHSNQVAGTAETGEQVLTADPNPFAEKMLVRFHLARPGHMSLKVYNDHGLEVASLFDGEGEQGKQYAFEWSAEKLAPGIYIVRLATAKGKAVHKKVLLVR
ncbi:PKD domain-containing protein [Rufibacter latericius]|uniref:PKD domain-containing protein n=1 Tax=Rufibacter latericius TaxID=2487040 RepID=UPI0014034E74|nr:hypothetical protein [Rufibacter latericius]